MKALSKGHIKTFADLPLPCWPSIVSQVSLLAMNEFCVLAKMATERLNTRIVASVPNPSHLQRPPQNHTPFSLQRNLGKNTAGVVSTSQIGASDRPQPVIRSFAPNFSAHSVVLHFSPRCTDHERNFSPNISPSNCPTAVRRCDRIAPPSF